MSPSSPLFLIITILLLVFAVVCFAQGIVGGGVTCAIVGALGLLARFKGKKKDD